MTEININDFDNSSISFEITPFIEKVCDIKNIHTGTIEFNFVSKETIVTVNQNHLKRSYITDVITFNYGTTDNIDGDIYICFDKVKENAIEYDQSIDNELKLVLVHSILHLLDYRDYTEEEKKEMYDEQNRILLQIN